MNEFHQKIPRCDICEFSRFQRCFACIARSRWSEMFDFITMWYTQGNVPCLLLPPKNFAKRTAGATPANSHDSSSALLALQGLQGSEEIDFVGIWCIQGNTPCFLLPQRISAKDSQVWVVLANSLGSNGALPRKFTFFMKMWCTQGTVPCFLLNERIPPKDY